jgi:plasmid stabilization system protein ParE
MSVYALTPLAKADIFDIWSFIAQDSEDAADRVEQEIYNACNFLAAAPLRGHSRADLASSELRFRTLTRYPNYPNYTVVYRPRTTPLQIVAVLHGKRNIPRILKHR